MRSKTIKIYCSDCQIWFASPLDLADEFATETSLMIGVKVACSDCNQLVTCDWDNIVNNSAKGTLW